MLIDTQKSDRQSGGSLIEWMVTSAIDVLLLAFIGLFFYSSTVQTLRFSHYCDLSAANDFASAHFTRDSRDASRVVINNATNLTLAGPNGQVSYIYDSEERTLVRTHAGVPSVLLRECDEFTFSLARRNPGGRFEEFPSASAAEGKIVEASWKCSRTLLGRTAATESFATAKIVIRKQDL